MSRKYYVALRVRDQPQYDWRCTTYPVPIMRLKMMKMAENKPICFLPGTLAASASSKRICASMARSVSALVSLQMQVFSPFSSVPIRSPAE